MAGEKLTFPFQPRKFVEVLAALASENVPDLTKLKAVKLIYFADRIHLLRFGRPIVGGHYACMDKGPVPSEALDAINAAAAGTDAEVVREIDRKLTFQRSGWQRYKRIVARSAPDRDAFSESELQVLHQVASEYGRLDVGDLIEMSHAHEAWNDANTRRQPGSSIPMSYEMFFHDNPVDMPVLEAARVEQEDRDFADAFSRALSRRKSNLNR